ncbi:beta-galactosidase [Hymenobacter gelipurpurascens]|uniref:Beta-galactosidase n=1 Tax=Hymenobacter gelipurpurascens TaxID=89968 RepID=A0A212TIY2_9BACT|nr:glycoside hydrolase family 2 TIM barrel-domain containing protein [Hymenobacter gelipurpurascens]SNC65935.1 beta-galactosidase [Hymenobacter gelipurpurascens]
MLFRCLSSQAQLLTLAAFLGLSACSRSSSPATSGTEVSPLQSTFNTDWEFVRDVDTTMGPSLFVRADKSKSWATVMLPHTPRLEPVVTAEKQWQGISFYRRFFRVSAADTSRRVAIRFEGAMNEADVYLNGRRLMRHQGGYLPFTVELTPYLQVDAENCLVVKLNNQDNQAIPPGKPLKDLDFNYYGGLYRPVQLLVQDPLRITDAVEAARPAGGGILLHYENASAQQATLHIQTEIRNGHRTARPAKLRTVVLDADGKEVASTTTDAPLLTPGGATSVKQTFSLASPKLWSPSQPYLYRVQVAVLDEKGNSVDQQELTTGVRTIRFAPDGFYLNGQKTRLRGTNRHQEYPYLGYALSDEMQYRDAWKIKEAGFNFVRCSHYPPSPAFLQACDALGLLVMNSIPGWQFFGDAAFQRNSLQNVRDMVRRDRNHPSIVIWEAALNETDMSKPFMDQAHQAVHEELPFPTDVYTCGWMDYAYDVFIPARQHAKAPDYWHKYNKQKPILLCEYGDWEYYAQNAGFNQTAYSGLKESERTSRQLRGQGERALQQQALNFQEAYNDNFVGPAIGDANWLMFDYKRGYAPDIESSGVMDIYRLPKFAFYFYQSQYGPVPDALGFGKPMVFIASYAQPTSSRQVRVYSNCSEVELQLNGRTLARQQPDKDRYSNHLAHPSFTFTLPKFTAGTLKAVAYQNGKAAAEYTQRTPGPAHHIQLTFDKSGRELTAGRQDAVFVYATVVDAQGTPVPDATSAIQFAATGNAELLGDNPVKAEAGIATTLLRAGSTPGAVSVTATASGLPDAKLELRSVKPQ